jgi:hypothetical protein
MTVVARCLHKMCTNQWGTKCMGFNTEGVHVHKFQHLQQCS